MKRREVISLLGGSALWPLAARGQQAGKIWRIGFLTPRSRPSPAGRDAFSDAFMRGMSDLGYSEGKNLVVAWRYADGDYKRLTGFAIELVGMDLPVIVTYGTAAARVLQGATKTIPIVVAAAVDLVGAVRAFSPKLSRVAVLLNPGNPANPAVFKHLQAAAPTLGVEVAAVDAATQQEIESAFAKATLEGAGTVIVAADAFFSGQGPQIAAAAAQHRLATISLYRDHALAGCLISYGQNVAEFHRQAARYVDKILKGAKPEDLPVEQPTKFDLVINGKTAVTLGLAIPRELLVLADEVTE